MQPLSPGHTIFILNEVDAVGLFEVQQPVCPSERIAQERSFVGVANEDARRVKP